MVESRVTWGSLLRWEPIGAGRRLVHCPRCGSPIELRLLDDVLEAACPGCGAQPVIEALRSLELHSGWQAARDAMLALGIVGPEALESALEVTGGTPRAEADDPRSGLVGAARALGLFRRSLRLVSDPDGEDLGAAALEQMVDEGVLVDAIETEAETGRPSGEVLAELVLASEKEKLYAAGRVESVDLDRLPRDDEALARFPAAVAASYLAVPVALEGERLVVAVADPLDFELIDQLKFLTGREIRAVAAEEDALLRALERLFPEQALQEAELPEPEAAELRLLDEELGADEPSARQLEAAGMPEQPPGGRSLNLLLLQLVEDRGDRLLIEALEVSWRVRLRRGGRWRDVALLERETGEAVIAHALERAGLDPERSDAVQQGEVELQLSGESLRFSVVSTPSAFGPCVVFSLRGGPLRATGLEALVLLPDDADLLRSLCRGAGGLWLVSAPPGSGKTELLYGVLREIDRVREHAVMFERRAGVRVEGAVQLYGDDYTSFGPVLAASEPERVLVDDLLAQPGAAAARREVRMALDLALGRATVVCTVTAEDALGAAARLVACGFDPVVLAATLRGTVCLRRVRRLCPRCRRELAVDDALRRRLRLPERLRRIWVGTGCWECGGTGYAGEGALVELVPIEGREPLRAAVASLDPRLWSSAAAQAGVAGLRDKALRAVGAGATSVNEVRDLIDRGA